MISSNAACGAGDASQASIIDLRGVSVYYGEHPALVDVTLTVGPGATGLVGRNGAGKSTLLRLLLGLVRAAGGSGSVLGVPIQSFGRRLRRFVGAMPESDALLPGMKAIDQVRLAGELCGLGGREAIRRAHEVLSYVGLAEARYRNVEQFSTGMKQRLKLAGALVHDPVLLLLDEPTVGLDPPGRQRMLDLLDDLVEHHGKSLLISTHLLADIQHTCEHVVMIEKGSILASGAMEQVLGRDSHRFRLQWEGDGKDFLERLRSEGGAVEERPRTAFRSSSMPVDGEAVAEMPSAFDARDFFDLAFAHGVRLRTLDREYEELTDLYHRLLARSKANP